MPNARAARTGGEPGRPQEVSATPAETLFNTDASYVSSARLIEDIPSSDDPGAYIIKQATIERGKVKRILKARYEGNPPDHPTKIMAVTALAKILNSADPGRCKVGRKVNQWPGLTHTALETDANYCRVHPGFEELGRIYREVRRLRPVLLDGDAIGEMLQVTRAERAAVDARFIKPVDATWTELRDEAAERRRERDRERKAKARRASGKRTKDERLAVSVTAAAPWKIEGISKRTWYRNRARMDGTVASPQHSLYCEVEPTVPRPDERAPRALHVIQRQAAS